MRSNGHSVLTFIRNNVEGLGRVFTTKKNMDQVPIPSKKGEKE